MPLIKISDRQEKARAYYAAIMDEVRLRFDCVTSLMSGETKLTASFVRESAFLQYRMICELIALGCLTAHGDIPETQASKLHKEYAADKIMDQLEKLHPDFFPFPVIQRRTGPTSLHMEDAPEGYLTKAELLELYGRCGGVLHRGSMKRLMSGKIPVQTNFPDIAKWATKIKLLLDTHTVLLLGGQIVFLCTMNTGPNGKPKVLIATAKEGEFSRRVDRRPA